MFYILCYSLILILLKPSSVYTLSSLETLEDTSQFISGTEQLRETEHTPIVESSQENETGDKKDFAENVKDYNGNAGHERGEIENDVFEANYLHVTEPSSEIRLDSNTVLPQEDEANADSEHLNYSERDFFTRSPSTIEQKPRHYIDTEEKSDFYQSSGNGHVSPTSEEAYQEKQRVDENDFQPPDSEATQVSGNRLIDTKEKSDFYQSFGPGPVSPTSEEAYQEKQRVDENDFLPPDSEATQVSESQLTEPEDTLSDRDRTERSFTDINMETRLNPTVGSFVLEADSNIESKSMEQAGTNGDINERTSLSETRENLTRELAGKTKLKLKKNSKAEDDHKFIDDNHLNQTNESFILESDSSSDLNPTQNAEVKDGLKPIFQNVLKENSYIVEDDDIKKSVARDEKDNFHLFNSSAAKVNQDHKDNSETKLFDYVSDLNSHGEPELALELLQRTNNNSEKNLSNDFELLNGETLPEENAAFKENYAPSNNNTNMYGSSEYSESRFMVRKIDSEYTSDNSYFHSENDKPVESSKHPYSSHDINYQSEPDTSIQNNIEQLTVEDSHGLSDIYEGKTNERNKKEFVTRETTDCLETAATIDHESADITSKLSLNVQKEYRIRDVDSDLKSTLDSTVIQNDSAHKENQSTFEYLENIEFNLNEVLHVITTDRNVQAFILNFVILYLPVLICDVLLWIVIVKLARHIRRQIISNQQPEPTESSAVQQNESEDVVRSFSSRLSAHMKSKRSEKDDDSGKDDGDDDFQDSSSEFLCISSKRKVWYPPS